MRASLGPATTLRASLFRVSLTNMNSANQSGTRPYSMATRADAATATSRKILESTAELYWRLPIEEITLARIAADSGVTVQTVIRKFGGRDEVFTAAVEHKRAVVEEQRNEAPVGDTTAIVVVLMEHYETFGDGVLKLISEEGRLPAIADAVSAGRRVHREWCDRVFAPELAATSGSERRRLRAQLVALCDVYTWKLLRRDSGLSRAQTQTALIELIDALKGARQ